MALFSKLLNAVLPALLLGALAFTAPAHAALVDFAFSAPGSPNASLGLNPVFAPSNDFGTGLNIVASAFAPLSGQLEVHRNRKNGLGVTGRRADPFANRINSHGMADDMESLRLSFSLPVQLISITFKAVGANTQFVLLANPSNPLSTPVFGTPTNGEVLDMSSFGLTGTDFDVSAGGDGQSLRVHSLRAATQDLALRTSATTAQAPAPATWALFMLGFGVIAWHRRRTLTRA